MNPEKKDRKRERKGFMKARDFRALARQALSGRWGVAVLTGFLAALLGGTMASSAAAEAAAALSEAPPANLSRAAADIMKFPTLSGPH